MRGKNILVVAMLLSIALTGISFVKGGDTATKIHVKPTVVTANPGEKFWVDITVEKAVDLYGWQIKLQYESGTKVIGALKVEEGAFLGQYFPTAMAYAIDPIGGVVDVGCTILGPYPGMYGDGVLCRIQFVVSEAGESELTLFGTVLLDSNLDATIHQTRDGFFDGINVELTMINIGARSMHVGDVQTFDVKVQNEDGKGQPLYVKARIDNTRIEDGRTTSLWTGQSYEYPPVRDPVYLYVDGFTAERAQWTEVGTGPFLDAPDDGNYIEGSANGAQHRWFTFEDIELGGSVVDEVRLWVYCEGPYDEDVDYDVYAPGFNWLGSYYGTGGGRVWQDVPRWAGGAIASEMYPDLLTEAGINGFETLCYFYDPLGHGGAGNIIDAMYLEITFLADRVALPIEEPVYVIQPGEVCFIEPLIWPLQFEDVGTYICTVTVYYSYAGNFFNAGEKKVITESWHVK